MRIASIIDISLVDVPGIPVTVLFTGGCNFDCPYCQNAEIIHADAGSEMEIDEIVQRATGNLVDGFCITGGEPTIHRDLPELLKALRSTGDVHINLNTQGSVPSILEKCLPYLDSVWFDIKSTPENYPAICRTDGNPWSRVKQSVNLLLESDVTFWPRTTYTGSLLSVNDLRGILRFLDDSGFQGEYLIQNYVASSGVRENERERLSVPDISEIDVLQRESPQRIDVRLEWR